MKGEFMDNSKVVAGRIVHVDVDVYAQADAPVQLREAEAQRLVEACVQPKFVAGMGGRYYRVEAKVNYDWAPVAGMAFIKCDLDGRGKRWQLAVTDPADTEQWLFPSLDFREAKAVFRDYPQRPVVGPVEEEDQ